MTGNLARPLEGGGGGWMQFGTPYACSPSFLPLRVYFALYSLFWLYPVLTGTERGTLLSRISALSKTPYEKGKLLRASSSSFFCRERARLFLSHPKKPSEKQGAAEKDMTWTLIPPPAVCIFVGNEGFCFLFLFASAKSTRSKMRCGLACRYRQRWKDKIRKGGAKKSIQQLCKRL